MSIAARADGPMMGFFQCVSPGASYTLTANATSAQSGLPSQGVTIVRLFSPVDCFIKFGANPTATTDGSSMYLPGGVVEYFEIRSDEKLAVIAVGATGTLYVTEGAAQ